MRAGQPWPTDAPEQRQSSYQAFVAILKQRLIESARREEADHSPVWTTDHETRFNKLFKRPSPLVHSLSNTT